MRVMAVILPNTALTVRRKTHSYEKDAHGTPVAADAWSAPVGPFPGALVTPGMGEQTDMAWKIRADMRLWPLNPDDELTASDGRVFIVLTARRVEVAGYDYVDFIDVTGQLDPPYVP